MKSLLALLSLLLLGLLPGGNASTSSPPAAASETRTATAARQAAPTPSPPGSTALPVPPASPPAAAPPCDVQDPEAFSIQLGDKGGSRRYPVIVRLRPATVPCRFQATFTARLDDGQLGLAPLNPDAGLATSGRIDVVVTEAYDPVLTVEWRNDCTIHGMFQVAFLLVTDGGPRTVAGGNDGNPDCIDRAQPATLRQTG